jgi:hypothetical protein
MRGSVPREKRERLGLVFSAFLTAVGSIEKIMKGDRC